MYSQNKMQDVSINTSQYQNHLHPYRAFLHGWGIIVTKLKYFLSDTFVIKSNKMKTSLLRNNKPSVFFNVVIENLRPLQDITTNTKFLIWQQVVGPPWLILPLKGFEVLMVNNKFRKIKLFVMQLQIVVVIRLMICILDYVVCISTNEM